MSIFASCLRTTDVFGVTAEILERSYVDRGHLDATIQRLLKRQTHIALRGESKCGKSWLRQRNLPDAITLQCRLNKSIADLYVDALSQLGINLTLEEKKSGVLRGKVEASQDFGAYLLAKVGFKQSIEGEAGTDRSVRPAGHDINDLRYIAEIIRASGKRLVIEDFHYLARADRQAFAFDLKALWDYRLFVVVIGIWTENNLLLHLNPDLAGRIEEIPIRWSNADLERVLNQGCEALNIKFSDKIRASLVLDSFGTVGILQKLALATLDSAEIYERPDRVLMVESYASYETAALTYAEQLNALYQTFAGRVSGGIRQRREATGIYAHMMAVVVSASDEDLSAGLNIDTIYQTAHEREGRIQKGNLRTILEKIDKMQVDEAGRGLVITYDQEKSDISVIDRQLLFYRKYSTVKWPWEDMIRRIDEEGYGFADAAAETLSG